MKAQIVYNNNAAFIIFDNNDLGDIQSILDWVADETFVDGTLRVKFTHNSNNGMRLYLYSRNWNQLEPAHILRLDAIVSLLND